MFKKLLICLIVTFGVSSLVFSQSKKDKEIDICMMGAMRESSTELISCLREVDPTLKILMKKDSNGQPLYKMIQELCSYDYLLKRITSKELLRCERLGSPT